MPIGSFAAVPLLVETLLRLQPRSVLDLGIGFGGNGVAVREWLDLGVRPWKTQLTGVECWGEYRNPTWDLYNIVYVQTIEQYLHDSQEQFSCVLLGDVLEHFPADAGSSLLNSAQQHVAPGGLMIVTTPATFFPQEAVYGNEHERHLSYWSDTDLRHCGFQVARVGQPEWCCGESWFATWTR
ncbi:MAG: methyltransferase domain-containing protein [Pirellulales bacterium]